MQEDIIELKLIHLVIEIELMKINHTFDLFKDNNKKIAHYKELKLRK